MESVGVENIRQNKAMEWEGNNLLLEIDTRKEAIIEQYQRYLETMTREELIEILTINQTDCSLVESIMDIDNMGSDNCDFEPV